MATCRRFSISSRRSRKKDTKLLLPAPFAPMRTLSARSSKSSSKRMDLNPSIDRLLMVSLMNALDDSYTLHHTRCKSVQDLSSEAGIVHQVHPQRAKRHSYCRI